MARVLVSPLNWGLGHATRDIPVIRTLRDHGHEVTIAACGNALSVLRQEFPDAPYIDYPDYSVAFSFGRFFVPRFCASLPFMLKAVAREHATLESILQKTGTILLLVTTGLVFILPRSHQFLSPTNSITTCHFCTGLLSCSLFRPICFSMSDTTASSYLTIPPGRFPLQENFRCRRLTSQGIVFSSQEFSLVPIRLHAPRIWIILLLFPGPNLKGRYSKRLSFQRSANLMVQELYYWGVHKDKKRQSGEGNGPVSLMFLPK